MKIITIAGTRPELIRLSIILKKLDKRCDHRFLWTGQNYTPELSDNFFKEFGLRGPDYEKNPNNAAHATLSGQLGSHFTGVEHAINSFKPDKALILGDTNSALSAIICERLGVPVYHMEAGNRCHDPKVPEERNRRVIDAVSTWALPYTPGSRDNLLSEGIPRNRIHVCGNPIYEVMNAYPPKEKNWDNYFLATFHRQENVDHEDRLRQIFLGLSAVSRRYDADIVCSIHPRTRQRITDFKIVKDLTTSRIRLMDPYGFQEFLSLERHAMGVLTDSGTVQEECCIFRVPTVTIRDSTERPETVDCGSNIVSGLDAESIEKCMIEMLGRKNNWSLPSGYGEPHVSEKVLKILDV